MPVLAVPVFAMPALAMIEIRAVTSPGEVRAAAVEGGALLDYAIHRPGARNGVGDRLRGRVIAHVPALAGAFVALPGEQEGFLPDSRAPPGLTAGSAVTVLVTRAPQGSMSRGKGPRLSAQTPQAPAGPPALLGPGPGAVERLAALHPAAPVLLDDPALAATLPLPCTLTPQPWDDALATEIDALAQPEVALPGGLRAVVHPTPALTAIDLDTAAASADRRPKPAAQKEANRAALPALACAIRLRNLSGAIVLDLAGMAARARAALGPDLAAALAPDPLRPRFLGFTALGLAEILRPRIHPPLHELLAGPHAAGLAALRHLAAQSAAAPAARFIMTAAPDVVRALDADPLARADLARRTGRPLILRLDPALPPTRWATEPLDRAYP